jgi:Tol biopolymer transport system component
MLRTAPVLLLLATCVTLVAPSAASSSARGIAKPTGKIAFDHITSGESSGPGDIYVVNAAGGGHRNLTRSRADDLEPAWSPNGRRIAFRSYRCKQGEAQVCDSTIHVMNADGSAQHRITRPSANHGDRSPAWSRAGEIAFVRASNQVDLHAIWVMNADGTGVRRVTRNRPDPGDQVPAWSPDGRTIAFVRENDIWLMRANGGNQRRLASNGTCPAWSRDGRTIAFLRNRDIWLMSATGRNQRRLLRNGLCPTWSPDGRWIAFSRQPGIWLTNLGGSQPRQILGGRFVEVGSLAWSPN